MKSTKLYTVFMVLIAGFIFAQDKTTVSATSSEISDNLDLRAIASIFGDSKDLEDFEYRINDPKQPISNLDLNQDNQVDYLRVIESVEGRTHIIVIQSVLGKDMFQDVATIEVEKDRNNKVYVQVVGDVYMYGRNYIYEPVYVHTPVIYTHFWVNDYRPYYSAWYWGYYPSYYYVWTPFPLFRYRHHIDLCINFNHHYNYVRTRRCENIYYSHYYGRRANGYERIYPNRSFENRNSGYANRYELDQNRTRTRDLAYNSLRNNGISTPRSLENGSVRSENPRNIYSPRTTQNNSIRTETPRSVDTPRSSSIPRNNSYDTPRSLPTRDIESPRSTSSPRNFESPRSNNSIRSQSSSTRTQSVGNSRDFGSSRGNGRSRI